MKKQKELMEVQGTALQFGEYPVKRPDGSMAMNVGVRIYGLVIQRKVMGPQGDAYVAEQPRTWSLPDLLNMGFKNSQVQIVPGEGGWPHVVALGGFDLQSLPVRVINMPGAGGDFIVAPGMGVEAVARKEDNAGNAVAFRVNVAGKEVELDLVAIDKIAAVIKPKNFVVRHIPVDPNKPNGKQKPFIAAKPGMRSVEELPLIPNLAAKAQQPAPKREVKAQPANFSFMQLLDFVKSMNGFIAYLPGTAYKKDSSTVADDGLDEVKAGQLAEPTVVYTKSSANINLKFKGLGSVTVDLGGTKKTIYPNVYREKSIYRNGVAALDKLGIIADPKFKDTIVNQLGGSLIKVEDEPKLIEFFARILGLTPGKICLVSFSLTGIKAFDSAYLSSISYEKLAGVLNLYEQINATFKPCKKILNDCLGRVTAGKSEVNSMLQGYSEGELAKLREAGIDTKNFVYTPQHSDGSTSDEKRVKLAWSIKLTDAAKQKMDIDVQQTVDLCESFSQSDNVDGLESQVASMKSVIDDCTREIWKANVAALGSGSQSINFVGAGAAKMVEDNGKMKKNIKLTAAIGNPAIESISVTVSNADGYAINK